MGTSGDVRWGGNDSFSKTESLVSLVLGWDEQPPESVKISLLGEIAHFQTDGKASGFPPT